MTQSKRRFSHKLNVNVGFPQQQNKRIVVVHSHLGLTALQFIDFLVLFKLFFNTVQNSSLTRLSGEMEYAGSDKDFTPLDFSLAVCTCPVHLVPGNQRMQIRITVLDRKLASNPLLNPGQHLLWIIDANDWCILNPQQNMVIGTTTVLVFLFPKVVTHNALNIPFQQYLLEKCMEFVGKLHRN